MKVTGGAAGNADFERAVETYTPIVFAFVLGLSFLLLMVAFRSIVVPINAILMNLLSVGAAYGLLVLVFQKGHGAGLFGFTQTPAIEVWLPIFLFCVLFGSQHGLPRLPAQPDQGALRPDGQQRRIGRGRSAIDGQDHHRRGADHGRRLRRVRLRPIGDVSRWVSVWRSRS